MFVTFGADRQRINRP